MNPLRQIEQQVLDQGREWVRQRLQAELQRLSEALPRVSLLDQQPLQDTRWRDLQLDTVAGLVMVRVRHGYSPTLKRWICPAREQWGLEPYERKSPELQARLAFTATTVGSYAAAEAMARTWGTPTSDDSLRRQVQKLGERAGALSLPTAVAEKHEQPFSLVIMMDGWMARERGADWGAGPRRKDPQRVAWHEIKTAVIYRLDQRAQTAGGRGLLVQKYCVASPPQTSPVDFGAAVQAEARRRGLGRAKHIYVVMDGAVWLWDLAADRFAGAVLTLDFHHAREHLQAVADLLHGTGTQKAKEWMERHLRQMRHGQETRLLRHLEDLLQQPPLPNPEHQQSLQREIAYFQDHRDHLHYLKMERTGAPLGSGAVESLGKQFQGRLRGCGQFWSRSGLSHLLSLTVTFRNQDHHLLWN